MSIDYPTLFAAGEAGGVWLANSAHWQEPARTTPATAGTPVGSLTDTSGNALHSEQATPADQPTLRQDATTSKWYIEYDDDNTIAGAVTDWRWLHQFNGTDLSAYLCIALRVALVVDPNEDYQLIRTVNPAPSEGKGFDLQWHSSLAAYGAGQFRFRTFNVGAVQNNVLITDPEIAGLTDILIEVFRDGSANFTILYNGAIVNTGNAFPGSTGDSDIGLRFGGKQWLYGALARNKVPTGAELEQIRTDMLSRMINPAAFTIGNNVTLANTNPVEPGEAVLVHKVQPDNSLALVYTATPDAAGDWSLDVSAGTYYFSYMAADHRPEMRGPYVVS